MNKKTTLSLVLLSVLLLTAVYFQPISAFNQIKTIPNIDHMIVASIGEPETVDPAKCYDAGSAELIINVYNQLIFLDHERLDAYENHTATSWTISPDGLTYKFYLRSGMRWHEYGTYGNVTKEDVEYSFERAMVQDYVGGPTWMYYEPITGGYFNSKQYCGATWPDAKVSELGHLIDDAIVSGTDGGGDYVQFNLGMAYAPFPQVLAQAWGAIIDYEWSIAHGAWPGSGVDFADRWGDYVSWKNHDQRYNAAVEVAFDHPSHVMMGSGPYEYDDWVVGDYWRITKFDQYWGGWPDASSAKYVSTVTRKLVEHWPTMKAMFMRGDVDLAYVPRQYIAEIEGVPGIRCVKDLPVLALDSMHYNYDVSATTQYFDEKPQLGFSEKLDLLSDIHMRTAISHCLDFATFIIDAYLGEADQPATPAIKGLSFNWEELGKTPWAYDLAKAKTEFQAAWGGQAWSNGFTLQLVYNKGNVARETACTMIEYAIENLITGWGIRPTITTHGLSWGTHFIPGMIAKELPVWLVGWLADYADIHNFIAPYMHPYGDFAYFQSIQYGQSGHDQYDSLEDPVTGNTVMIPFGTNGADIDNSYMMDLIELGIEKVNYWERRAIYNEIQDIWLEEYVGLAITQPSGRHWERDWVQGWYYNSLYGGSVAVGFESTAPADPVLYFRYLWKGLDADINGDDYVDMYDSHLISACWHSPPLLDGPLGYDRKADIWPTSELDGANYLIPGADGKVNIADASLINAQWHDSVGPPPPAPPSVPNAAVIAAPDIDDENLTPGSTFSINITAANVSAMWGYEFILSYDTTILTAINYMPYTPFTKTWPNGMNDLEGYVSLVFSMPFGEPSGFSTVDPVPIARIDFSVDALGMSSLDLSDTKIGDIYGDPIPRAEVDGSFSNIPPAASASKVLDESKSYIDTAPISTTLKNDMRVKISDIQHEIDVALKLQTGKAREMIHDARKWISEAEKHGLDVSEAEEILERAEVEFANETYELALRDALNARQMAIDLLKTVVPNIKAQSSEEIWESFCETQNDKFDTILRILDDIDGFIDKQVSLGEIPADVGEAIKAYNAEARIWIEKAKERLTVPL